jgi:hypothetical protein
VFPNPNSGFFSVYIPNGSVKELTLSDVSGKNIRINSAKTDMGFVLEKPDLQAGIYYLSLTYTDGTSVTKSVQIH